MCIHLSLSLYIYIYICMPSFRRATRARHGRRAGQTVGTCVGGGFKGGVFNKYVIASCVCVATVLFAMLL